MKVLLVFIAILGVQKSVNGFSPIRSEQSKLDTGLRVINGGNTDTTRIINGQLAADRQFPFQLFVLIRSNAPLSLIFNVLGSCGGSIIHTNWALTAAHCIEPPSGPTDIRTYQLLAGSVNRGNARQSITVPSRHAFRHNGYNRDTLENDIGLFKVNLPLGFGFTFSDYIAPIELSNMTEAELVGKLLVVSGFGTTTNDRSGPASNQLYYTSLTAISKQDCLTAWRPTILPSTSFCVEDKTSTNLATKKASCAGDSGGPITYTFENGTKVQVGLVSFGSSLCNQYPDGYTLISLFLGWILEIQAANPISLLPIII
ncbi:serine proteases 1/2-like [Sergentomyia squamirostris]